MSKPELSRRERARLALVLPALLGLAGCFSLPPPEPTGHGLVSAQAPDFDLPATGKPPGKVSLASLTSGTAVVLVFYRGHW